MRGGVPRRRCCPVSRSLRASPRNVWSAPNTPLHERGEGECVQFAHWAGEAGLSPQRPRTLAVSRPRRSSLRFRAPWSTCARRPARSRFTRSGPLPAMYGVRQIPLSTNVERGSVCSSCNGRDREESIDSLLTHDQPVLASCNKESSPLPHVVRGALISPLHDHGEGGVVQLVRWAGEAGVLRLSRPLSTAAPGMFATGSVCLS